MAGGVVISPNVKKTSDRLNKNGDIIDPKTKQVIEKKEEPYAPTSEELAKAGAKKVEPGQEPSPQTPSGPSPLKDLIQREVNKAIVEAIKEVDISQMVSEAIKQAFKP